MSDKSNNWKKAQALMNQAEYHINQGNTEVALGLANEAVSIAESGGFDPFNLKIRREMMLIAGSKKPDFSGVVTVMKETLAIYLQENENIPQIIDLLINLAGFLLKTNSLQEALHYLDQAEGLLKNTTADEISHQLPRNRLLTGSKFVSHKLADVERLRKYIEGTESS